MPNDIGSHNDEMGGVLPSKIEQQTYEKDLYAVRIAEVPSNMQFRAIYTNIDGLPDYTGAGIRGLPENVSGWILKKFTYDVNRQCTKFVIAYDSWTNATLASYI